MKILVRDSKPDEGAPDVIEMHGVDAHHAIDADPERYSIEEYRPVVPPRTLEQRMAAVEARLDALEPKPEPEPEPELASDNKVIE